MLLTRLERENKNMDKEKLKFYSIGRGSLNLDGKFYYGLDYAITDFMMDLEQQVKKQKEVIDKAVLELVNIDGNLSNSQLSNRICNLIDILKKEK